MSRLATSNGWSRSPQAEGWTVNNTVGIDTTNPLVAGAAAFSISAASSWAQRAITGAVSTSYFLRAMIRPSANPTALVSLLAFKAGATLIGEVDLGTLGQITLRLNTVTILTAPSAITVGSYNLIELGVAYPASGAATLTLRINGVTIGSGAGSATLPTLALFGNGFGSAVGATLSFTDIGLNDSNGTDQNSWPGRAATGMMLAASDNSRTGWTDGVGGTTNLAAALKIVPPSGVASGSLTATSQIKDSNANATDTYQAIMGAYSDAVASGGAAVPVGATVTLVQALANGGHAGTVTNYTLAVSGISNPVIAEGTVNPANTAAGAYPTAWTPVSTAPVYSPAVTLGTAPVLQVRKGLSNINAEYYDLLALIVEYTVPQSLSHTLSMNQAQAASVQRSVSRAVAMTQAQATAVQRAVVRAVAATQPQAVAVARAVGRTVTAASSPVAARSAAISATRAVSQSSVVAVRRALARGVTAGQGSTVALAHGRLLHETVAAGASSSVAVRRDVARSVLVAPVGAIDPATLSGRVLDLDASKLTGLSDGDPMSTWTDESGSTTLSLNPDDTSQPAFREGVQNGLPGVYFDGHSGFVLTPPVDVAVADGWCVFWVLRPDDPMPQGYGNVLTNNGSTGFWIEHNDPPLVSRLAYYSDAGDFYTFTSVNPLGATQVSTAAVATDGTMQLHVDGVLAASDVGVGENETFDGVGSDNMIPFPGHPDYDAYGGYMFRVVVFDRQLTPTEIAGVQAFLAQQWLGAPAGGTVVSVQRAVSRTVTSPQAPVVALARGVSRTVAAPATGVVQRRVAVQRSVSAGASSSVSCSRALSRTLSCSQPSSAAVAEIRGRPVSCTQSSSAAVTVAISRRVSAGADSQLVMRRAVSRSVGVGQGSVVSRTARVSVTLRVSSRPVVTLLFLRIIAGTVSGIIAPPGYAGAATFGVGGERVV